MRPDVGTAVACLPRKNLETHTVSALLELQTLNADATNAAIISREREVAEVNIFRQRQLIADALPYFEKWQCLFGSKAEDETLDSFSDGGIAPPSPVEIRRALNGRWQRGDPDTPMPDRHVMAFLHPDVTNEKAGQTSGLTLAEYTSAKAAGNLALVGALRAKFETSVVGETQDLTYQKLMLRVYKSYAALSAVPGDFVSLAEVKKWQAGELNLLPATIRLDMLDLTLVRAMHHYLEISDDGTAQIQNDIELRRAKQLIGLRELLEFSFLDEKEFRQNVGNFDDFDEVFSKFCDTNPFGEQLDVHDMTFNDNRQFIRFINSAVDCIDRLLAVPASLRARRNAENNKQKIDYSNALGAMVLGAAGIRFS